jgi:hypothetical protein
LMSVYSPGPTADESMNALDGHVFLLNGAPCCIEMLAIYEDGNNWLVLFTGDGPTSCTRMVCVPRCGPAQLLRAITEHLTSEAIPESDDTFQGLAC